MIARLPLAAVMMLVILSVPAPKTGGQAVLVEVLSIGSGPIEATKLAIFQNLLTCNQHVSDLAGSNPLIESRVALVENRVHYDQSLRCFPSKALWTYWRHAHCLDGGQCA